MFSYWEGGDTCLGGGFMCLCGRGRELLCQFMGRVGQEPEKVPRFEVFEGTKTVSIHVSHIHVLRMVECL